MLVELESADGGDSGSGGLEDGGGGDHGSSLSLVCGLTDLGQLEFLASLDVQGTGQDLLDVLGDEILAV